MIKIFISGNKKVSTAMAILIFVLSAAVFAEVPDVDWPVTSDPTEQQLENGIKELSGLVARLEAAGLDASYVRSALTVAENFAGYAREDEKNGKPGRAAYVRGYLADSIEAALEEGRALLADPSLDRPVPDPSLRDIEIRDGAFFAGGEMVMFGGVGHFGQVRKDIPQMHNYGFNIIQIEIGPSSVVKGPEPGDIDTSRIMEDIIVQLDRAAEHNVMINLLLSPHYFPKWALEKYPGLGDCEKGFLKYCTSDPRARDVIRRFLDVIIPMIKDKPALHSYTLANEPIFDEKTPITKSLFSDWLAAKYGDIGRLNKTWGKKFKNFEKASDVNEDLLSLTPAARLDWSLFHNTVGTGFFRFMKETIRKHDPDTPVHIKFMDNMFDHWEALCGLDREVLGSITDISGNDSAVSYRPEGEYRLDNRRNAAFFDYLKSVRPDLPVFNSENHIIGDDSPVFYPAEFIYASLMLQYLHGMGASTIWVWERSDNASLGNNILSRPNCAAAAARATLDARRLAREITAISNAEPKLGIYLSRTVRGLQIDFVERWKPAYEIALYQGRRLRFITDRTLENLDPATLGALIIPEYLFTSNEMYRRIVEYVRRGGNVIAIGDLFGMNERGRQRKDGRWAELECGAVRGPDDGCVRVIKPFDSAEERDGALLEMSAAIEEEFKVEKPLLIITGESGRPVRGVEYRSAEFEGGGIGYVFNATAESVTLKLRTADGGEVESEDLLGRKKIGGTLRLAPLELVMFRF
ncbi:MAG TPA: beta-galactosidase [bacterium]|nr:beta-galactosidase [bacterium]